MQQHLSNRLNELARRAGLSGVPPVAVGAAIAVCLAVIVFSAWRWWPQQASSAVRGTESGDHGAPDARSGATSTLDALPGGLSQSGADLGASESATSSACVYVHVVGAVRRPGLYEVRAGGRVADAIASAGGMLANAAQAGVNLARVVTDGEQIVVPTADEFASGGSESANAGGVSPAGGGGASGAQGAAQVNINTADATMLDSLPGVGPSTAAKIVADREANGPFASVDDLGRVAGIGPKKLEEIKPRVCVR